MNRSIIIMILAMLCLSGAASAKNREKERFNLLAQYRTDIPAEVIKKAKKMGTDVTYPRIHDSWIENPHGQSIDLQGKTLFPNMYYTSCKPVSPTHFQIGKYNYGGSKYGVMRTDNTVIIPMDNLRLDYFPLYNIIIAYVDWNPVGDRFPKKGKVRIYNYYGDLLHEIDDATMVASGEMEHSWNNAVVKVYTDTETNEFNFPAIRTDYEQDNITKFYSDGPQAATYNIIRELCASNKKGDQTKALDLLDYYMDYILPDDNFAKKSSSVSWDATLRYLACLNFTKEFDRLGIPIYEAKRSDNYQIIYAPGVEPEIKYVNDKLPEVPILAAQVESLLRLAVDEYQKKQIRDEQRRQTWMAVLGVLANSLSSAGGYTPVSGANYTSNTTTVPQINTGKTMLEQTSISPEIMGAAIAAGWTPETPSSSSSLSSTTQKSSSSTPGRVCHACFGKGQHQACNGSGTQLAFGNKRTEKCSGCHGSGKCPQCNGTGYH